MSPRRKPRSSSPQAPAKTGHSFISLPVLLVLLICFGIAVSLIHNLPGNGASPNPSASAGASASPAVSATASSTPTSSVSTNAHQLTGTALALLGTLIIAPEHSQGYARDLFKIWIDADGNGCDTRNEVLIAEAITPPKIGAHCALSGGTWLSVYDGLHINKASALDIDHLVPLDEAWRSGAYSWTSAHREAYANDLDDSRTLIAVSAASNRSKGDKDPANWLPQASYQCTYASDWVAVKVRWGFTVDSAEQARLTQLLTACPADTISVELPN